MPIKAVEAKPTAIETHMSNLKGTFSNNLITKSPAMAVTIENMVI